MRKFSYLILFICGAVNAQKIDHPKLLGEWSSCTKDSAGQSTPLLFINKSVLDDDSCPADYDINNVELIYQFRKDGIIDITSITSITMITYSSTYKFKPKKGLLIINDELKTIKYRVIELSDLKLRLELLN
jgi:hypothetical protein